jgi:hypothetical protein
LSPKGGLPVSESIVTQKWDCVEATITVYLVASENDGAIIVNVKQLPHLYLRETLAMAVQALADRLVNELTPPPGAACEKCGSYLESRWSTDWAYSIQVCPGCGSIPDHGAAPVLGEQPV